MSGHVFVSHGSDDRVQANELAAFVESKGAKVWIAPRNVRPGQDYSEQLQEAIENCCAFLVLVTDKANKSPYVRAETEMAFSLSKPIFPVRLTDIKPAAGLAFFLKIRHWTDAFGDEREANLARLARELQTAAGVEVDSTEVVTQADARVAAARSGAAAPPPVAEASPPAPPPPAPPPSTAPTYPQWQPQTAPTAGTAATVTAPTVAMAPAAAVGMAPAGPATPADQALLAAAIGPNSAFYLDRWAKMDAKGSAISWNWPACLFNFFWFAYRKMWLPMAGVFVVNFALLAMAGSNPQFGEISWLFSIGISFITGGFGNYLYRQQIDKLIEETAPLGQPAQLAAVTQRGGVSKLALAVSIFTIVAASSLSVLATTGLNPRTEPPARRGANEAAPAEQNVVPPQPGAVPGYDTPPAPGSETPQPPATGQEDPNYPQDGTADDQSFQQDEARQDEVTPPAE